MEFRGRGHRVPPIATKCTHRRVQRALQCVAPSGTGASEQHQVSTFVLSGAQFSRATAHHQAPLCAALRAMPTNADLTLICAGALQEPSQPIFEMRRNGHASQRRPPSATGCYRVPQGAHICAPLSATERCHCAMPPAACRMPPRSTACRRAPPCAAKRRRAPQFVPPRAVACYRVPPSARCRRPT